MHREHVYPPYMEDHMTIEDSDKKFELANNLDDTGCTPKCAPHLTFGLETADLMSCEKC